MTPLWLERLLPYVQHEPRPEMRAVRTTLVFLWDSRTYILDRSPDGWQRLTFIGHRLYLTASRGRATPGRGTKRSMEAYW